MVLVSARDHEYDLRQSLQQASFAATGMVKVTEALLTAGFSRDDIGKVMGGNEIRLLLENLPD